MQISEINDREDLNLLVQDRACLEVIKFELSSRERSKLKEIFGTTECRTLGAISFFMKEVNGEVPEIYAFSGQVPNLCKELYPIRYPIHASALASSDLRKTVLEGLKL